LADWDNLNNLRENAGPENKPSPPRLERKHFETVALASAQFDKYLVRVRSSDQTRAKAQELRRDDFTNEMTVYPNRSEKSKAKRASVTKSLWPALTSENSDSETGTTTSEADSEPVKKRNSRHEERHRKRKDDKSPSHDEKKTKRQDERERGKVKNERKVKDKPFQKNSPKPKQERSVPPTSSDSESVST